jgi:hypothetical protein
MKKSLLLVCSIILVMVGLVLSACECIEGTSETTYELVSLGLKGANTSSGKGSFFLATGNVYWEGKPALVYVYAYKTKSGQIKFNQCIDGDVLIDTNNYTGVPKLRIIKDWHQWPDRADKAKYIDHVKMIFCVPEKSIRSEFNLNVSDITY